MMNSQSSRKQTMNRGSQALEIPKGKRNLKQITLRHHKKFNTACINQFHARFPLSAISGFGFRRFGSVLYAILRFILYSAIPRFILYSAIPPFRFRVLFLPEVPSHIQHLALLIPVPLMIAFRVFVGRLRTFVTHTAIRLGM